MLQLRGCYSGFRIFFAGSFSPEVRDKPDSQFVTIIIELICPRVDYSCHLFSVGF